MSDTKVTITQTVTIKDSDIDEIMEMASFYDGTGYWCEWSIIGKKLGEYVTEQVSHGGRLAIDLFEPAYSDEKARYILTKKKLIEGVCMYIADQKAPYNIVERNKNGLCIDDGNIDSTVADMIVQYALFKELVFS